MGYFTHEFLIGARDIDANKQITDKALLGLFLDIGSLHSDAVGCGLAQIDETNLSWVVMQWKVDITRRPVYGETVKIRTWLGATRKLYMYRQYEITNSSGEVLVRCNSQWVLMDLTKGAINVPDWVVDGYGKEDELVFDEWKIPKLKEPENPILEMDYKVPGSVIDVNGHMNNMYYIDVAANMIPFEKLLNRKHKHFEIMYKKESTYGEILKCKAYDTEEGDIFTMKTEDEKHIHAIVKFI